MGGRDCSVAELGVEWEEGGLGWSLRGDEAVGLAARGLFGLAVLAGT